MKRIKIDLSDERKILAHMIASTPFLNRLCRIIQPLLFSSSYCRTVATWVMDYYQHVGEAPHTNIQDIYLKRRGELQNEEELDTVADFLTALSKDWEKWQIHNLTYTEKQTIEYFKLQSLARLRDNLNQTIESKSPVEGEKLVAQYKRIEKPSGEGINLLTDTQAVIDAFEFQEERLFQYPGVLGATVGPFLRGDFYAILGAPKRGKSWWLWYTVRRAALLGLKAVFFSFEMTDNRMTRRGWQSFVAQPVKSKEVTLPYFHWNKRSELWYIRHKIENRHGVDKNNIKQLQTTYKKKLRDGDVRIETFPAFSATVSDIKTRLENLEYYEGFVPDVVAVDYADIVKPDAGSAREKRHQLDDIWKELRALAQQKNILVATGSQVNAEVWEKDIKGSSAAENKNKAAHITKMIALNQSESEEEAGIMRVQSLFNREERRTSKQVVVLQCFDIARTYLDSRLNDDVWYKSKVEKK